MNRTRAIEAEQLPNGSIVGHVAPATWYVCADGVFSIHVATYPDGTQTTLRADTRTWPSSLLTGEAANYVLLRNATPEEAQAAFGTIIKETFDV